jgi:hypothetical protein
MTMAEPSRLALYNCPVALGGAGDGRGLLTNAGLSAGAMITVGERDDDAFVQSHNERDARSDLGVEDAGFK